MITTDLETRQLLARERRDQLARDMRLGRAARPEAASSPARRALARAHDYVRALPRLKPSRIRQPQEVLR
jgi:hypothetical protein